MPDAGRGLALPPASRRSILLAAGALVLAGVLAYANSFTGPFIYDDRAAITENPTIRQLWPLGPVLSPPTTGGLTVSGRPVLNLTLALNYAIGGTAVAGYHAFNLGVHLLAGLTLLGIVRRTLLQPRLRERFGPAALPLALAVAGLWVVHPLQTEAVTYVVQRAEALMALFYLLTLYGFIRSTESSRPAWWRTLAVTACLLGMASKESMVSAPLLVLLYDRIFVAGTFRAALAQRRKFYAACVAATWLLLACLVAGTGGNRGGSLGFGSGITGWAYALAECRVLVRYLGLAVWPHSLVFEYEKDWGLSAPAAEIFPSVLFIALLASATLVALWRRPALGFAGAWFFAILAPTSSILPMQSIAEHRMYLPLVAVITVIVLGAYALAGWRSLLLAPVLAMGLGWLTVQRNADYRSELAIWQDTAAKRPGNARAHFNLGALHAAAGRWDEAGTEYRESLRLNPDFAQAHGGLGYVLLQLGQLPGAIAECSAAVRLKPTDAEAHNNLGNALLQSGRAAEATGHYEQARQIKSDFAEADFNLGTALLQLGRVSEAVAPLETALRLRPDYFQAHNNLGTALFLLGRLPEARAQFEETLRLRPNDAQARNNLAHLRDALPPASGPQKPAPVGFAFSSPHQVRTLPAVRVLLAFDKFKDSLTAHRACDLAAAVIRERHPDWSLDLCPLADGGEGFAEILTAAAGGRMISQSVTGPLGRPVPAAFGLVPLQNIPAAARALLGINPPAPGAGASVAVIEMAAASGLAMLSNAERDPWQTTTRGTGELIRAAGELGAAAILLGVGGSATNDLGLGALEALGLEFQSLAGAKAAPLPAGWAFITKISGQVPASLPPIRIACDVTNPLLGPNGAAAIYGPQKGLRPADLARLDHESARLALLLCMHGRQPDTLMDTPGAGAAGGLPFGLMAAARAKLLPGFDLVSAWLDLEARLARADVVITGEGRFDESSLNGKGPGAVAARALALGKTVQVFAGAVQVNDARPGLALHAITPPGTPLPTALRNAGTNLTAAVRAAF